jgi:hypothetical protein
MQNAAIRDARSRSGHLVDAGTYWLVEDAILQASKTSGLDPIRRTPWERVGRIGAAVQSTEKFRANDDGSFAHKRVSIHDVKRARHSGHDVVYASLTIKVGELSKDRAITWPIILHRPLPPGAVVKRVAVQRIRSGHRFKWEALVTVSYVPEERDVDAVGTVGIDLGWRREKGGLMRVATHDGSDGGRDALRVDTLANLEYAAGVRSIRDRVFDEAKAYVKKEGLAGADHAHLWKDKDRMRRLAARETVNVGPAWWQLCDKHLEDIECGVRAKAIRRRLDAFRVYADRLAKRYRYVALEDMAMSAWVGEAETHAKESHRNAASLSLLQQTIAQRFGPERVDWVPMEDSSRTCSDCGSVRAESVGPRVEWICASCGVVHHQDENAAAVLRDRCERWIAGGKAVRARGRKGPRTGRNRWADGIATGDERRMTVTAREPISSAAE